jgi:hypothetical protein
MSAEDLLRQVDDASEITRVTQAPPAPAPRQSGEIFVFGDVDRDLMGAVRAHARKTGGQFYDLPEARARANTLSSDKPFWYFLHGSKQGLFTDALLPPRIVGESIGNLNISAPGCIMGSCMAASAGRELARASNQRIFAWPHKLRVGIDGVEQFHPRTIRRGNSSHPTVRTPSRWRPATPASWPVFDPPGAKK